MSRLTISTIRWTCDNCGVDEDVQAGAEPGGWLLNVDVFVDGKAVIAEGDYCGADCLVAAVRGVTT